MIPGGYDIDTQISSTDSAQVWLARDPSGAPVVIKMSSNKSRVERRFKREIEALKIAAGPHAMPVLDHDGSYTWYSMPVAIRTLYETAVPTSLEECLLVLEAISAALRPIHSLGQVHRDLKPQNILWLADGASPRWVVADFGIVRNAPGLTTEQLTRINGLTGSQGWAAPEQYREAHLSTITADVFGAGGILSWMLTGERPSFGSVKLPTEPRLRSVIRRATNPNPTLRYSNLDDFLAAVRASAVASVTTFESLVDLEDWPEVGSYILGHPSQLPRVVAVLPRLRQPKVHEWFNADRAGLVSAVTEAVEDLGGDIRDLPFGEIDKFLSWGVTVLRVLVNERDYEAAEQVATALFGATAGIGQFAPAAVILDFLNGLSQPAQRAMEAALHSSSSFEFFQRQVGTKWRTKGESDLVLRLREE